MVSFVRFLAEQRKMPGFPTHIAGIPGKGNRDAPVKITGMQRMHRRRAPQFGGPPTSLRIKKPSTRRQKAPASEGGRYKGSREAKDRSTSGKEGRFIGKGFEIVQDPGTAKRISSSIAGVVDT
jgi:hypothetical protein